MRVHFLLLMLLFSAGCTTLQDATDARGAGKVQSFNHSYDDVWAAAVQAVDESALDLVAQEKSKGEILGQKGISAMSYGENVAVFVTAQDPDNTAVEVVSKKAMATNVFAKNWSDHILEKIANLLK